MRIKSIGSNQPEYRDYPSRPTTTEGLFLRGYSYEQGKVADWQWSGTFGKWTALVEFTDGYRCWTYAKS